MTSTLTYLRHLPCLCMIAGAVACGGTKAEVLSDGGPGGSGNGDAPGSSGSPGSNGTGLPSVSCGNDNVSSIQGTWDLIVSGSGGRQSTGTLTIDGSTFSFGSDTKSLTFTVSGSTMTLLWRDSGRQVPIATSHGDSPLDLGIVPLALGGQWSFQSTTDTESCIASLGANGFNASCNGVHSTPFGELRDTVVGQRTQKLASVFGELGGTWHVAANSGGSVDVTIQGNAFSATGQNASGGSTTGSVSIKVCEGSVSGVTSAGFEIAGTRQ